MLEESLDDVLAKASGSWMWLLIRIELQDVRTSHGLPPVTRMTFVERSGRSLSAVKEVIAVVEVLDAEACQCDDEDGRGGKLMSARGRT